MKIVARSLEKLEIGPARTHAGLSVFPLLAPEGDRRERPYRTLDQALGDGTARVTEISDAGSVPELRFVNDGERPVLLIDGEELVGAKQNRILNLTILAPAKASIVIPVSCVEAGRWSSRTREFSSEQHVMYAQARSSKARYVSHDIMSTGRRRSDQGKVWDEISRKSSRHGVKSPTSEMREVFRSRSRDLDEYVAAFPAVERQVGVLFALGSEVRGVELFDCEATLRELLPKIVRSWALDAVELRSEADDVPSEEAAKGFIGDVGGASVVEKDAVGLGVDVRFTGDRLAGGALVHEDGVVHLCAFRLDEGNGNGEGSRYAQSRIARASRRGRWN